MERNICGHRCIKYIEKFVLNCLTRLGSWCCCKRVLLGIINETLIDAHLGEKGIKKGIPAHPELKSLRLRVRNK